VACEPRDLATLTDQQFAVCSLVSYNVLLVVTVKFQGQRSWSGHLLR